MRLWLKNLMKNQKLKMKRGKRENHNRTKINKPRIYKSKNRNKEKLWKRKYRSKKVHKSQNKNKKPKSAKKPTLH